MSDSTDTGSYWPWIAQTNTGSARWFSLGVLNNSFYIMGSTTSKTANSYDYCWRFDVSNGWAYGNFSNSDTVDSYHASSFYIHDREAATSTSGTDGLWGVNGSRSYHNALPDGLSSVYGYGQVISFATDNSARFQIYASHVGSDSQSIYFRTGWGSDKKAWRTILHNGNWSSYCAAASHQHNINDIKWPASHNLVCSGANTEWSIDMASDATGSYWHVWSGVNSASCLLCYNDNRHVAIPVHLYVGGYNNTGYGLSASSICSNGTLHGNAAITAGTYVYAATYLQAETYVYLGAGYPVRMRYNNAWWDILRNYNNGNTGLDAAGGGVYLGYSNSTLIDFMHGKGSIDSSGNTWVNGTFQIGASNVAYHWTAGSGGSYAWFDLRNSSNSMIQNIIGYSDRIYISRLHVGSASDVSPNSGSGGLVIGSYTGGSIGIDDNEIMARSSNAVSTLYINSEGGNIYFTASSAIRMYNGELWGTKIHNAVWNDFAEYRQVSINEPGRVVIPDINGIAKPSTERLQAGGRVISDTYGCTVGESDTAKTPLGMAGRVLAYPYRDIHEYHIGDAVCSAPNGTVDIMTREEIKEYPDRIIGIVNEIPTYATWTQTYTHYDETRKKNNINKQSIQIKGRIWIDIK